MVNAEKEFWKERCEKVKKKGFIQYVLQTGCGLGFGMFVLAAWINGTFDNGVFSGKVLKHGFICLTCG